MVVPTLEKVLLALLPRAVMAVMHTTMIRASMTAYSTAVGPSSFFRKLTRCCVNLRMLSPSCQVMKMVVQSFGEEGASVALGVMLLQVATGMPIPESRSKVLG